MGEALRTLRLCLAFLCGLISTGLAADVVFQSGKVGRGVKIASETETWIEIVMPEVYVELPEADDSPAYEHKWNFEWVLLGLLALSAVWMRSLQWVQQDLYQRQGDPRFWSMVALLLPGVGALVYGVTAWVGDAMHQKRKSRSSGSGVPATDESPSKLPWMMPARDPAEYLASKGNTRKGFEFQDVIHSRNGMILATGPTGSGKTSTLYAALRQLDATRINIMTIEDPAEYELAGATQIAVKPRAGITYESGLRSILRQDPDVILVGEMRDTEATQVALRAALTGHLVLSSLHTKDAVGTISRLQDMGIERYQVASALLMIIAQRLVRVLCPHCCQACEAVGDELDSLGFDFEPGVTIYKPVGCDQCLNTGFRGRTGIFELLVLDEEIGKAVSDGVDEASLAKIAEGTGFRSYRYDGAEKILLGITTVEEVLQAV
jgi:hypothetical protein